MADQLTIDVVLTTKKFEDGMKNVRDSIGKSNTAFNSFIGNLGANAFASAVTGLGNVVSGLTDITTAAILAAIDAEETASKFDAVFEGISDKSEQAAKDLQTNFGLGVTESKNLLAATGDLLTGFGLSREGALDLSVQVQQMSVDLASFTNFTGGASGASEILTKAMLGETEGLKTLGIAINADTIKRRVATDAAEGLTFENDKAARSFAIMKLITEASGNAIGDYAKTSDGAANQLKLFNTVIEDMSIEFGQNFLPAVEPAIKAVNDFLLSMDTGEVSDFVQKGLVFLIDGLITVVDFINPVVQAFQILGASFVILQNLLTTGVATIVLAISTVARAWIDGITAMISIMPDSLIPDGWKEGLDSARDNLTGFMEGAIDQIVTDGKDIDVAFKDIGDAMSENLIGEENLTKLRDGLTSVKDAIVDSGSEVAEVIVEQNVVLADLADTKTQEDIDREQFLKDSFLDIDSVFEEERLGREKIRLDFEAKSAKDKLKFVKDNLGSEEAEKRLSEVRNLVATSDFVGAEAKLKQIHRDALAKADTDEIARQTKETADFRVAQQKALDDDIDITGIKTSDAVDDRITEVKRLRKFELDNQKTITKETGTFLDNLSTLQQSGSREAFEIGKAAAIAKTLIDTQSAAMASFNALAGIPIVGPALGAAAAAAAIIAGGQRISSINNTRPNFEHGGIVAGASFTGDNVGINVNSREMMLNMGQQTRLLNMANGQGGGAGGMSAAIDRLGDRILNMEIVMIADDNEIARSTSRGVQEGIEIGVSR